MLAHFIYIFMSLNKFKTIYFYLIKEEKIFMIHLI